MSQEELEIVITEDDRQSFKRLDQFLAKKFPDYSRSFLQSLFKGGHFSVSEESPSFKLELKRMPPAGTIISIDVPPPLPSKAEPEDIPLDILYEDEHLIFVNKPAGMVTHPAPGNYTGTLVNAILHHCNKMEDTGHDMRPGIVHRLDKGTSGVMVVAKDRKTHEGLVLLFSRHEIQRIYNAIVIGKKAPPALGKLEGNIGRHPHNRLKMAITGQGRHAITHYRMIKQWGPLFHMEFRLETGRTHQIRVHSTQLLNMPLLMDPLYGNPTQHLDRIDPSVAAILKDWEHPLLHARKLGLVHPVTKKYLEFETLPPSPFSDVLDLFEANDE